MRESYRCASTFLDADHLQLFLEVRQHPVDLLDNQAIRFLDSSLGSAAAFLADIAEHVLQCQPCHHFVNQQMGNERRAIIDTPEPLMPWLSTGQPDGRYLRPRWMRE